MDERTEDRGVPYAVWILLEISRLAMRPVLVAIVLAGVTHSVAGGAADVAEPPLRQAAQILVSVNGLISAVVFGGGAIGWLMLCTTAALFTTAFRLVVSGYRWRWGQQEFVVAVVYQAVRFAAQAAVFLLVYTAYWRVVFAPPAGPSPSALPVLMPLVAVAIAALAAAVITTERERARNRALSDQPGRRSEVVQVNDHLALEFTESWSPDQDLMVITDSRTGQKIEIPHEDWVDFAVGVDAFHQAHCRGFGQES